MRDVLRPISSYGETGLDLMSGDGVWRRCHLIFAVFVGDYPEQGLVTCTFYGRCPKCTVPLGQLGEYESFPLRVQSGHLDTYQLADSDIHAFNVACRETGMKPIYHPFWVSLPLADVFHSITPDILHRMHQGMIRHAVLWIIKIFGAAAIDTRSRAIPPNHNIKVFTNGITVLSRVSGFEHKKMCAILLGLIRVVQSCHLLATYHVTYFTTYLIRRTRRRAISGIMNFVDAYSQAPTYCLCLSGRLFGNPNSGCSPDLFSLTCLLFPCVVVPSLIIASLVFSHTPPLLLGQRIHLLSRWLVQS
jgi:hypothetical protein